MPPWVPPIPTTHQRIKLNVPIGCRIYATATRPNPEAPHELQTLLFTNEGVRPLSGLNQNATSESLRLGDALPLRERSGWGDSRPSSFRGPSRLSGRDRSLDRTSSLYDQKGIVTCAACDPASGIVYFSDGATVLPAARVLSAARLHAILDTVSSHLNCSTAVPLHAPAACASLLCATPTLTHT